MQKESYASDKIAVNGVLLPNLYDHLRVGIDVNAEQNTIEFHTLRAFDTKDPLDTVVKIDSLFDLIFLSGDTATTEWDQRVDHGTIQLFLSTEKPVEQLAI